MRRALPLCLTILAASGAFAFGCADTIEPAPAQVVLVIDSNARIPTDFNAMDVTVVSASGGLAHGNTYPLGEQGTHFPAYIPLVAGDNPNDPITVTITGLNQESGEKFIVNKLTMTEPKSGIKMLRMPLDFLCLGVLDCPTDQTCIAGTCAPNAIDVTTLEDFSEDKVLGGSARECFDTDACFAAAAEVIISEGGAGCKTALSAVDSANYGLWYKGDPKCANPATPGCIIPLDRDSNSGWQKSSDVVLLPQKVCDLEREGKVSVIGTLICKSKTVQTTQCKLASYPGTHIAPGTVPDGGIRVFDAGSPLELGNKDGKDGGK